MGRIRTIKPEFPHSETIGHLSRDARLLFIQLWTIADDSGRARASSRMLASLLYPYDDDVPKLIEGWLRELSDHDCIRLYSAEGSHFLEVTNWLKHQKIDKPSPSKIPPFDEASRIITERSTTDLGPVPRTKDQISLPTEARPSAEPDNAQQAVEIYNAVATEVGWAVAQRLTTPRRSALKKRLAECGGVAGWQVAIDKAKASPFLCGENERGWKADLDFFCQAKSFTKLMEGSYDHRKPNGTAENKRPHDAIFRALAKAAFNGAGEHQRQADTHGGAQGNGATNGGPATSPEPLAIEADANRSGPHENRH